MKKTPYVNVDNLSRRCSRCRRQQTRDSTSKRLLHDSHVYFIPHNFA